MRRNSRYISLDICDYNGNTLCNLFDSAQDLSGQAYDVYCKSQRNGFKELRFKLPAVCIDEELGNVRNYRLDKLISDYRIRTKKRKNNGEFETDWFLISEEKVIHESKMTFDVRASHISHLLRTKALDKEFSDQEGNNVGTIYQIAEAILEGTGWHLGEVAKFYEEDKFLSNGETKEKVRSFNAAAKTGAFKMMSDLCDMFDAKVVYHGEGKYQAQDENGSLLYDGDTGMPIMLVGRTADILPMNPFSKDLTPNTIPETVLQQKKVLELHYEKNIKNVSRTMKTENLVTKLSAYGSYGDLNGMCSLQTAEHAVITFTDLEADTEYYFIYNNARYYFRTNEAISEAKWSALDYVSRTYLYYYNEDELEIIKVFKDKHGDPTFIEGTIETTRNYFPFVMDFSYYQQIGLLTDRMHKELAKYQIEMPTLYETSEQASVQLAATKTELMKVASDGEGYLKLDIRNITSPDNYIVLNINSSTYSDGIIYRSDYDESKRNYFTWRVAKGIKSNGEALSSIGSVIYLVRDGYPTKWVKSYIKFIGNNEGDYFYDDLNNRYVIANKANYTPEIAGQPNIVYIDDSQNKLYIWKSNYSENNGYMEVQAANYEYGSNKFNTPTRITLWKTIDDLIFDQYPLLATDTVYMFSANSIAGMFGPREDSIESNIEAVQKSVQVVSETHPFNIIYKNYKDEYIDIADLPEKEAALQNYGWAYVSNQYHYKENDSDPDSEDDYYKFGQLYFLWSGKNVDYSKVYVSFNNEVPSVYSDYYYYYDAKYKRLYKQGTDTWDRIKDTVDDDNVVDAFCSVVSGCIRHEILIKGIAESYTYHDSVLQPGNYAFKNEFNSFWLFTTDIQTDTLRYITSGDKKALWQDDSDSHILKPAEYTFDVLTFPSSNEIDTNNFAHGDFNEDNMSFLPDGDKQISGNIYVFENVAYNAILPLNSYLVFCNKNNVSISFFKITNEFSGEFTTPVGTTHIRLVYQSDTAAGDYKVYVKDYENKLFIKGVEYTLLPTVSSGDRYGMPYLMDKFISLSNKAYTVDLPALQEAQNVIKRRTNALMESLGDLYREGFWQETNYVEGDESKLYADSLDNLKEISHPETTYEFGWLYLYKTENITDDEDFNEIDWPDIDISYAAHLVDMDIDTNCWAYIDTLDECLDQPWKSTIEINTKLSNMGQQSFTDVLASIAQVANEVKSKQAVYQRASAISGAGQFVAEKIAGMLQTNRTYINGSTSNWYTDAKGNIIFEDTSGESAMMLSGRGWAVSTTKSTDGDWEWNYIATGKGLNAESIYSGYIAVERIEAGSITADKLSSMVGQDLEIGSNKALALYATKDGSRPAGSVLTKNESIIEISTGDETKNEGGYINVRSGGNVLIEAGGELDVKGGNINIQAENVDGWNLWIAETQYHVNDKVVYDGLGYKCKVENSDAVFDEAKWVRASDGNINIYSGGNIFIDTEGTFNVSSGNLFVGNKNGQQVVEVQGKIIATSGNIAGFEIGNKKVNNVTTYYMYGGGKQTVTDDGSGIYLGTDGINVGGKFIFLSDGTKTELTVNAGKISLSAGGIIDASGIEMKPGVINIDASSSINIKSGSAENAASMTLSSGGITLVGSQSIDMVSGTSINMVASNKSVFSMTDSGIAIGAVGSISIATGGTFTITSGKFSVDASGNVYIKGQIDATSGSIGGWYIGSNYIGSADTLAGSKVGVSSTDDYAFWAGSNVRGSSQFRVTPAGAVTCSNLTMTGGSINGSNITISAKSMSLSGADGINIASGGTSIIVKPNTLDMNSAGLVRLTGKDVGNSHSFIKFTNGSTTYFEATSTGSVSCKTFSAGSISGTSIDATNLTVTHLRITGDHNLNIPVFKVSTTQPSGHKFFWVKPNGETSTTTVENIWSFYVDIGASGGNGTSQSASVTGTRNNGGTGELVGQIVKGATVSATVNIERYQGARYTLPTSFTIYAANGSSLGSWSGELEASSNSTYNPGWQGHFNVSRSTEITYTRDDPTQVSYIGISFSNTNDSYVTNSYISSATITVYKKETSTSTTGTGYDSIKYID